MDVKKLFDPETRSLHCPGCSHSIPLSEADIRTLAGILMGSCKSERKALAAAENGRKGGRFKAEDPSRGGIIAPATASRYVRKGIARYGDYIPGNELPGVWSRVYGTADIQDLRENPQFDTACTYRMVIRTDIPGRVDFYCVDYYRKRNNHDRSFKPLLVHEGHTLG